MNNPPKIENNIGPTCIQEKKGKKAYCTCDRSKSMPFCDGAHKGTGIEPCIIDIPADRESLICGCGYTKKFPYCDGTHQRITSLLDSKK